jgi:Zn-finger nucleic acid-binding protein
MKTCCTPSGVIHCPSCGGLTSDVAARCAHCGQPVARATERNAELPVSCPGCGAATEFAWLANIQVDLCPVCKGIWFDRGELVELPVKLAEPEMARAALEALSDLGTVFTRINRPSYLQCPVCSKHMTRRNYRKVSGILTDHCEHCGTWIDHASIGRILQLIATNRISELDRVAAENERDDAVRLGELTEHRAQAEAAANLAKLRTDMIDVSAKRDGLCQDIGGIFYDVLRALL